MVVGGGIGSEDDAARVCARLAEQTGRAPLEVQEAVGRACSEYRDAPIREYVALFVERSARRYLGATPTEPW